MKFGVSGLTPQNWEDLSPRSHSSDADTVAAGLTWAPVWRAQASSSMASKRVFLLLGGALPYPSNFGPWWRNQQRQTSSGLYPMEQRKLLWAQLAP